MNHRAPAAGSTGLLDQERFKTTQRLGLGWRSLNGGLTLMTLLPRGARFVDGIYIPDDVERPDDLGS